MSLHQHQEILFALFAYALCCPVLAGGDSPAQLGQKFEYPSIAAEIAELVNHVVDCWNECFGLENK